MASCSFFWHGFLPLLLNDFLTDYNFKAIQKTANIFLYQNTNQINNNSLLKTYKK